jgi:hypothetical protein
MNITRARTRAIILILAVGMMAVCPPCIQTPQGCSIGDAANYYPYAYLQVHRNGAWSTLYGTGAHNTVTEGESIRLWVYIDVPANGCAVACARGYAIFKNSEPEAMPEQPTALPGTRIHLYSAPRKATRDLVTNGLLRVDDQIGFRVLGNPCFSPSYQSSVAANYQDAKPSGCTHDSDGDGDVDFDDLMNLVQNWGPCS